MPSCRLPTKRWPIGGFLLPGWQLSRPCFPLAFPGHTRPMTGLWWTSDGWVPSCVSGRGGCCSYRKFVKPEHQPSSAGGLASGASPKAPVGDGTAPKPPKPFKRPPPSQVAAEDGSTRPAKLRKGLSVRGRATGHLFLGISFLR